MKRLILICAAMGLILGSASPPDREPARPKAVAAPLVAAVRLFEPAPAPVAAAAPAPAVPAAVPAVAPAPAVEPAPAVRVAEAPSGAVRVLVSIPQQRAWVFRGSELVATSRVSTGRRGHPTPTGTFPILEKRVEHYSNLYDNAPMPYMQRLTLWGIALHGGRVPGYPASHGCIRLPHAFARRLYRITARGTPVTITRARPRSARDALRLVT
jgi:lipoprotein-anchoring transpeptidase ErfK/SrfK